MLREIVRPVSENYNIYIPKEYINTEVEILVLPFNSDKNYRQIEAFSEHSVNNH